MKLQKLHSSAFTLIEIIIAMTIFGVIMVSVLSIFLFSSQMSTRVEINRVMQENIKNVTENISENIRLSSLQGVAAWIDPSCSSSTATGSSLKLCLNSGVEYTLWYDDGSDWKAHTSSTICNDITQANCHIIKRDSPSEDYYPLSNSFTHFENINFEITNEEIPKVFIHMSVRPSAQKWLASEIVQNGITHVQTSISERLITTR